MPNSLDAPATISKQRKIICKQIKIISKQIKIILLIVSPPFPYKKVSLSLQRHIKTILSTLRAAHRPFPRRPLFHSHHTSPRRSNDLRGFFMHPKIFSKKWEIYLEGKNIFTTFALPKSNKQQQQQQSKPYASRSSAIL